MSKRFIDADMFKQMLESRQNMHNEDEDDMALNECACIIEMLDNAATTDVVEVVRCKDCIYSFMSISGKKVLYCDMHPSDDHLDLDKDYFCSYGERKEQ